MNTSNKVLVIVAALILAVWFVSQWPFKTNRSVTLSEAPHGGDFTLDAASGPFELKAQRGKAVLLYFGYTFCPDICPTNLMLMAQAFNALDTLDKLATYTKYFHPAIIGVTGKPDHIARIAKQYGAVYRKVEDESRGGYLIDHSANTYVIAPDGSLHTILPHATPPEDILRVIRSLLSPISDKQSN